jgi:hypothetical protein
VQRATHDTASTYSTLGEYSENSSSKWRGSPVQDATQIDQKICDFCVQIRPGPFLPHNTYKYQHSLFRMEEPQYVVHEKKIRAILPKVILLLGLGTLFYLGILLNISLLELDGGQETTIQTAALILVVVIIIIGIYIAFHHSQQPYKFYRTTVLHNKKEIKYVEIGTVAPHQNFFDKLFKTYSIKLGDHFTIHHVSQEIQLQPYLQQLIQYVHQVN